MTKPFEFYQMVLRQWRDLSLYVLSAFIASKPPNPSGRNAGFRTAGDHRNRFTTLNDFERITNGMRTCCAGSRHAIIGPFKPY